MFRQAVLFFHFVCLPFVAMLLTSSRVRTHERILCTVLALEDFIYMGGQKIVVLSPENRCGIELM